jgi:hypothetical protein
LTPQIQIECINYVDTFGLVSGGLNLTNVCINAQV